jgi:hypothetical protein
VDVDIVYLPDGSVNLVVPPQAGLTFEYAAPRLAAFAQSLRVELGVPVRVTSAPEKHLDGPGHVHLDEQTHRHA